MSYIAVCTSLHFTMECSILIRRKVHELILLRFLSLSLSLFLPIRRPIGSLNKILEQTPSKRDRDSMQQRMHRVPSCRQTGSILSVVLVPLFLPASADPFTIPSHCHFHRVSSGTTLESFSRVVVPFKGPPWKTTKFLDHWTVLPSTAQLATSSVPVLHPLSIHLCGQCPPAANVQCDRERVFFDTQLNSTLRCPSAVKRPPDREPRRTKCQPSRRFQCAV